jgi:hypothetical protein
MNNGSVFDCRSRPDVTKKLFAKSQLKPGLRERNELDRFSEAAARQPLLSSFVDAEGHEVLTLEPAPVLIGFLFLHAGGGAA